jgi:hypothetical protein
MKKSIFTCLLILTLCGTTCSASDWYVMDGARGGNGSSSSPFKGIYQAIDKATIGDVIHVVQGSYTGKLKAGFLVIDKRGLTLAGGYKDGSFTTRNPFLYPTFIEEATESKNSSFTGEFIRVTLGGRITEHESTTIDGFWFDRKSQNVYDHKGNLVVAHRSNTNPVIKFEQPDCHIRNCVFVNSAQYAVRLCGDGSSVENNLFVNCNYAGIEIYGKGRKLGTGYPFNKFLIKNNTFVSLWNAESLEGSAGSALFHSGSADIDVVNNIFHLSYGNSASMGWAFKDERNFKNNKWLHLKNNTYSQLRGGIGRFYLLDQTATIAIEDPEDLREIFPDAENNVIKNPMFDMDKEWFKRYSSVIPDEDVSNKKVDMNSFNKMRSMMGLPLDGGTYERGKYLGTWYPVEHVKTGSFLKPEGAAFRGIGVQAQGPFSLIKGKELSSAASVAAISQSEASSNRSYEEVSWDTLYNRGTAYAGKAIKLKCWYTQYESSFGSGFGDKMIPYLAGATRDSHEIINLRQVPEMGIGNPILKGFMAKGSAPSTYVKKNAAQPKYRGECGFSFMVHGTVHKAGAKLFGKGPSIVISIDNITPQ